MTQKFANAARAYLVSTISDSATTVTIDGGGSLFPAITAPEFSRAVLQDNTGIEVVRITAHTASSNSFTVTRAQEGTTARSFAAGSVFGLRMTAADGDTFVAKVSGPGSATDSALAAFDGTTGKLIKQAATVTIAQGGTGQTTRQAAMDALAGAVTAGQYLRGDGTDVVMSAIQAADVPTLNQNTTGQAGSVTNALTAGTYLTSAGTYNGSAARTFAVDATDANTASKVVARDASGNFSAGTITATLSGNATSATSATSATTAAAWTTGRTLTIGATGKTVNGSANVAWSLAEIGAGDVTLTGTQTLTNKTLTTPVITQNVQVISGNTTAVASRTYVFTASLTLTLPASPTAGDWVAVSNRSGTSTPVIGRNGQNIMGLAEDMTVNNTSVGFTLVFADATRGWVFA
jgi:hypothetical protein